jgi:hypothetical protein
MLPLAAVFGLIVLSLPADAQWKWRDAGGQVNVSDLPPPREVPEKDILARPTPQARTAVQAPAPAPAASAASAPAQQAPSPPVDRELEARRKAAEQEQAAKARAEADRQAAIRAENCRRARGQVAALESGQRMARFNEKGEREVLDDKARADELSRARAIVASDCR